MKIVFVRHGHPNYRLDRLTVLGHRQAEAAAERLAEEGIQRIYSSTCGRALETAEHTADRIGIPRGEIVRCDFMREIHWGSSDGTPLAAKGHPWNEVERMEAAGLPLNSEAWAEEEPFCHNKVVAYSRSVCERSDIWMRFLGYRREGDRYRVERENDSTVAMFSHAGSSTALLSHLFHIPFPQAFSAIRPDFTAITVAEISGKVGELTVPRFVLLTDARHIKGIEGEKTVPQY